MLSENKNPVNLSGDAFRTFVKSIYLSIDNKDIDTFRQLNSFIYQRLSSSYQNNNIKSFEQFSGLFVWYYEYSLNKLSSSVTYKDIYDICADRSARGLKERLAWWFRFYVQEKQPSLEEKKKVNRYSGVLLNRFASLISVCLRKKNLEHLPFILNELQQSSNRYNHALNALKWDIFFKRKARLQGEEAKKLAAMEELYSVDGYVDKNVRLLFKASLFWIFFLYDVDVLTQNELLKILDSFQQYHGYINSEFVEDFIMILNTSGQEYAWEDWDYMERMSGVSYSPPSPLDWAPLGASLYSLQQKEIINIDTENLTPEQVNAMEYALSSMLDISKTLKEKGYEKWGKIIGAKTEQEFETLLESQIASLNRLKNKAITSKEKYIADLHLEVEYVENFKNIISESWEKNNDVRKLFNLFEKVVEISEDAPSQKMLIIGIKQQVWLGYKTTLIKNDNFHIPVYGIERYGQTLAESEESFFFSSLDNESVEVGSDRIFDEIDTAISKLSQAKFTPSVIFCGFDIWRRTFQDLKSSDFSFNWNDKQGYNFNNFGGVYKGLPIVFFRSVIMQNRIIIADFKASFTLKYIKSNAAYKNILNVNIDAITKDKAMEIIEGNPQYWKRDLSEEDAVIALQNSILVDFYVTENFVIDNKEAYSSISINTL